jgi:hypothetical protein
LILLFVAEVPRFLFVIFLVRRDRVIGQHFRGLILHLES